MTVINIAKDFSRTPFGRYLDDGAHSGERFREEVLIPALNTSSSEVVVDFSGLSLGVASSFIEEAFGGLVRKGFDEKSLLRKLKVVDDMGVYQHQVFDFIAQESHRQC
ncbi:STAS-like domain-containing protein [Salinivibrio sp. KP-1]|uniref:STAS-like domain-containing protein n=1 Tax=Salinivibrio sp. KP-1 TaxID=1406902 RepID=UPI00061469D4|nr:STAS-like domain-containing protein [Salinivibrio sp. KP-1]KKA43417.1 hypothetical protein WN56_13575 [Salinivibrio sp. KP-1]